MAIPVSAGFRPRGAEVQTLVFGPFKKKLTTLAIFFKIKTTFFSQYSTNFSTIPNEIMYCLK